MKRPPTTPAKPKDGEGRPPKIGVPFHATPPGLGKSLNAILNAHPGCSAKSQEARLEVALRKWSLTSFEMLKFLDLYDPRARIQGLRLAGHDISKRPVKAS